MPRVKTYYYDPAKLEGRIDTEGGENTVGGVLNKRSILQKARDALDASGPPPATPMEALMQAAPGNEPATSAVERIGLYGPLHDAMETLTPRERWVVEAIFWRRMALRQLEAELAISKTQIARIRDNAIRKLSAALSVDAEG